MRTSRLISVILIFLLFSCVDRITYPVLSPEDMPVAIYGYISNRPGPYQVNINTSVDPESVASPRVPVSARKVSLLDDLGSNEEMKEVSPGVYQTNPNGIQGRIGGVYKLRVELLNGNVFESAPDTLAAPGAIDSLYHEFSKKSDLSGQTSFGFDLKINSRPNAQTATRYMWNFVGTFKAITHPELIDVAKSQCYPLEKENNKCNFLPLCTGLRNTAAIYVIPQYPIDFKRVEPCTCCTCWYGIFNDSPILSDEIWNSGASYDRMFIYRIPLDEWIFMFKVHTQVTQYALTKNTFNFFKSIKDQKIALGSLFQPITGKIPGRFVQIGGTPSSMNGIFYAAGIDSKSAYITPDDVPNSVPVPTVDFSPRLNGKGGIGWISCLELFPNSTNVRPDFWID